MRKNISKTVITYIFFAFLIAFCLLDLNLNHKIPQPKLQNQDEPYIGVVAAHKGKISSETFLARNKKYVLQTVEILENQNKAIESLQSKLKNAAKIVVCNPPTPSDNSTYAIAEFIDENPEDSKGFNEEGDRHFTIMKVENSSLIIIKGYDLKLIQDFEKWKNVQESLKH